MIRKDKIKDNYIRLIDSLELNDTERLILKSTWLDYLILLNKSAGRSLRRYNIYQISVIVFSLLIPVIESSELNPKIIGDKLSLISMIGLLVAILTGINRILKFDLKWRHYRVNAEVMRNEGDDFFALAGKYIDFSTHQEAFKHFITVTTIHKREEVDQYMERGFPAEGEDGEIEEQDDEEH